MCGMVVDQKRLNTDYPFEFIVQEITSKGYCQIQNKYKKSRAADSENAKMFQFLVATKLANKARSLFQEVDKNIEVSVDIPEEYAEEEAEAEVYVETGFSEIEAELATVAEVQFGEVKRRSFLKKLRDRFKKDKEMKEIEEVMAEVGEIEVEIEPDIEVEIEGYFDI